MELSSLPTGWDNLRMKTEPIVCLSAPLAIGLSISDQYNQPYWSSTLRTFFTLTWIPGSTESCRGILMSKPAQPLFAYINGDVIGLDPYCVNIICIQVLTCPKPTVGNCCLVFLKLVNTGSELNFRSIQLLQIVMFQNW